jgi:geranylgeranyl diphosphate synthase type I
MPAPEPDDTHYVAEVCALIESVLRSNLGEQPFLECLEFALRNTGVGEGQDAPLALLPIWACQAAGGDPQHATTVSAAWCLLHTAALLLDDVEDGELASKTWPAMSPAQGINVATAFVFAAQLVLEHLFAPMADVDSAVAIWRSFNRASLQVCAGQHLDLAVGVTTLEQYWQIAAAKSGCSFSLACRAGAMLGTRDSHLVDRYADFGYNLGILVQISDDFNGVWNPPGRNDLVTGSTTLPVIYALSVGTPEARKHLHDLLERAPAEPAALAEIQEIAADLGALEYLVVKAEAYRAQARAALPSPEVHNPAHDQLLALLNRVMAVLSVAR